MPNPPARIRDAAVGPSSAGIVENPSPYSKSSVWPAHLRAAALPQPLHEGGADDDAVRTPARDGLGLLPTRHPEPHSDGLVRHLLQTLDEPLHARRRLLAHPRHPRHGHQVHDPARLARNRLHAGLRRRRGRQQHQLDPRLPRSVLHPLRLRPLQREVRDQEPRRPGLLDRPQVILQATLEDGVEVGEQDQRSLDLRRHLPHQGHHLRECERGELYRNGRHTQASQKTTVHTQCMRTFSTVVPLSSARTAAAWITGPSASGSE